MNDYKMNQKIQELQELQKLPLERKIGIAQARIAEWYEHFNGNVYISFSGGKDSTVLLDIVRKMYPDVEAVFSNTGLEYPEIVSFVKSFDNITVIRPKKSFKQVLEKYGYPVISKEQSFYISNYRNTKSEKLKKLRMEGDKDGNYKISDKWKYLVDAPFEISSECCNVLKKKPFKYFEKTTNKKAIIGVLAEESILRKSNWYKYGCNMFEAKRQVSKPLSVWREQDVLEYIKKFNLPYASVYGELKQDIYGKYYFTGEQRTGCIFCMYGCHLEKNPNRFQKLAVSHPKLYDYCINKLKLGEVLDYIGVDYKPYKEISLFKD